MACQPDTQRIKTTADNCISTYVLTYFLIFVLQRYFSFRLFYFRRKIDLISIQVAVLGLETSILFRKFQFSFRKFSLQNKYISFDTENKYSSYLSAMKRPGKIYEDNANATLCYYIVLDLIL